MYLCLSQEDREVVRQWGMDIVPFTRFLHHSALYSKAVVCRAWEKIESTSEGGAKCNPITREKL